jgi:glycosyltransferase involved in cell wall biosynthesis
MKKFSIITPTYKGRENSLSRAIECVNNQTYSNWEHIIVADGSINYFCEQSEKRRVITLPSPTQDSGNTPRSVGLLHASSDYVLFFDDDNVIFPQYLWTVKQAFSEHNHPLSIICGIYHFGPLPASLGEPPQMLTGSPPVLQNVDTLQFVADTGLMKEHGWLNKGYLADGHTIESYTKQYGYVNIPSVLGIHL